LEGRKEELRHHHVPFPSNSNEKKIINNKIKHDDQKLCLSSSHESPLSRDKYAGAGMLLTGPKSVSTICYYYYYYYYYYTTTPPLAAAPK